MRTTVTLDRDVALLLKETMHRSRKSFKQTLNDAIRTGLEARKSKMKPVKPFTVEARAMGNLAGIDPAGFNKLADELEVEAYLEKTRRLETR